MTAEQEKILYETHAIVSNGLSSKVSEMYEELIQNREGTCPFHQRAEKRKMSWEFWVILIMSGTTIVSQLAPFFGA